MQIKDVEDLAELAKIDLTDEEKAAYLKDMGGILEYVKIIESVDLPSRDEALSEMSFTPHNVWRKDEEISPDFSRELIIGQFPDSQDGFLKVKKIL